MFKKIAVVMGLVTSIALVSTNAEAKVKSFDNGDGTCDVFECFSIPGIGLGPWHFVGTIAC